MGVKGTLGCFMGSGAVILVLSIIYAPGVTKLIFGGLGLSFIFVAGIGLVLSNLYIKARGNLAFFKTGMGGPEVIMDKGRVIIGIVHEIMPVSLETMKIVVPLYEKESLITSDKLRAELKAEFYIRVKPDREAITRSARTLGDKVAAAAKGKRVVKLTEVELLEAQTKAVTDLQKEKLINALRTVGAHQTLEELNQRIKFKEEVIKTVAEGLSENGMEVEDVTMSSFDQAPKSTLDPNNSFDAQGLKALQEIVSENQIMENKFKRDAELEITKKDVETRKAVLEQQQDQEFAEADKDREVRTYAAEQTKNATVAEIENKQKEEERDIEKSKAIETAEVEKQKAIETAEVNKAREVEAAQVEKEKAIEAAQVEKEQAVEVAKEVKLVEVAKKDAERAQADTKRNIAEAEAEKAKQSIETVTVTETAEREKQRAIIAKQAEIEKQKQEKKMEADVDAYAIAKKAEGRKEAAQADYEATIQAAKAKKESDEMQAAGQKAKDMVPVEVEHERVKVKEEEVKVERQSLENQSQFDKIAKELKIALATIEMQQMVQVEQAKSIGVALSKANLTLWGDTVSFNAVCDAFRTGQVGGTLVKSFADSMPKGAKDVVAGATMSGIDMVAGLIKKATGKDVGSDVVKKVIETFTQTTEEEGDKREENEEKK